MTSRVIAFSLFCVAAAALPARAADPAAELRAAQALLSAGDYQRAYGAYSRVAEQSGSPLAYFTLALFHRNGWGRAVDPVEACHLNEIAARGAIPAAEHFLGDCLRQGIGRVADPAEAAMWYRRAADHGHVASLCALAELLIAGNGVERDVAAGLAVCGRAAAQGSPPAMVRMGSFYLEGDAGTVDYAQAAHWFEQAAGARSAEGAHRLAIMLRDGQGQDPNPARAREFFELAAGWGYAPAYFQTARLYFEAPLDPDTEMPTARNLAKAYIWLSVAIARSPDAVETAAAGGMLSKVLKIMPETWVADLDAKVEAHLARFAAP